MIYVVARSQATADLFFENHSTLKDQIKVELGHKSFFKLINKIISDSSEEYACVVHDDVILCNDFTKKVNTLILNLERNWKNWGVVGNSGTLSFGHGYSSSNIVRYISDPHGGPNLTGCILPAQTIDGNVMLLNVASMRKKGVSLPEFDGFQLYDIILSIETIFCGLGVLAAPELSCWHGSTGNQHAFNIAKRSHSFGHHLSHRLANRSLKSLNGNILIPLSDQQSTNYRIDIEIESLRTATKSVTSKTVSIIVRTRFTRPSLLLRTLLSIRAFIAASGETTKFSCFVVSDQLELIQDEIRKLATVLDAGFYMEDSRYKLVEFSINNIVSDYYWFIDDDDWIFPNEAETLSLIINGAPQNSLFFLDCQHFNESTDATDPENASQMTSTRSRYFYARDFVRTLSGLNHTPFCGVIFNRKSLMDIPEEVFNAVTYYEDLTSVTLCLLHQKNIPIVVSRLFVGISLRPIGNTVTETDRTKWNKSMSESVSILTTTCSPGATLTIPALLHTNSTTDHDALIKANLELAKAKAELALFRNSRSMKLTRPFRLLMHTIRNAIKLLVKSTI